MYSASLPTEEEVSAETEVCNAGPVEDQGETPTELTGFAIHTTLVHRRNQIAKSGIGKCLVTE